MADRRAQVLAPTSIIPGSTEGHRGQVELPPVPIPRSPALVAGVVAGRADSSRPRGTTDEFAFGNANLQALREASQLHTLRCAAGKNGGRPCSADEVLTLNLASLPLSTGGLKQFRSFRNVSSLDLSAGPLEDDMLTEVAGFRMLSTLVLSRTGVTNDGRCNTSRTWRYGTPG